MDAGKYDRHWELHEKTQPIPRCCQAVLRPFFSRFSKKDKRMRTILVVYWYKDVYPLRSTIRDHLYCFRDHRGKDRVWYLNLAYNSLPLFLRAVSIDLIVYHTLFMEVRGSSTAEYRRVLNEAGILRSLEAVKVALPQDENYYTDRICEMIDELGIGHVFSAAAESEWTKIYRGVDLNMIQFHRVLPGYLSDDIESRVASLQSRPVDRSTDIGYRARRLEPFRGKHALLKSELAVAVEAKAKEAGLATDVSTRETDTFLGDDWFRFMLRCKYVLGVEGGASLMDRDGSILVRGIEFRKQHPDAAWNRYEAAFFPGQDGRIDYRAISPRHLEACATRTCQILIEGDYNGILKPGEHYIELRKDFSNVDEVLDKVKKDDLRAGMVERTYQTVVLSRRYSYSRFVQELLETALGARQTKDAGDVDASGRDMAMRLLDSISWLRVWAHHSLVTVPKRRAKRLLQRA